MTSSPPILLFDGVCNLCSWAVQFLLTHEREKSTLCFGSLQSDEGAALLKAHGISKNYTESVIYIHRGEAYTYSDAALQVSKHLKAPFRWLSVLLVFPKSSRDYIYKWVARNRYGWFGKKEACWLPNPEWNSRFIDSKTIPALQ